MFKSARLCLGVIVLCSLFGTRAYSQTATDWPNRSIKFVVGFAPGGSTDIAARIVAQQLTIKLGQTVVVENKPGVSGVVGHNMIATAKPDGYSFLFASASLASSPSLMKSLPYDVMNDFVPVAQLTVVPAIVAVHPSVPAKNIKEFVDYVKANPGKVNYGSAGSGSFAHISGALFEKMIQGSMVHIPFKGGALANLDLVAGRVHVVFGPIVELMPFVSSGAVRALGVTSHMRSASFPDAHAVAEVVPGYEMSSWHGVFATKGTNPEIVDAMNKAINAVLADPAIRTRLIALGLDSVKSTQQEFIKFYFDEIKRWKELVNIAGAKQE